MSREIFGNIMFFLMAFTWTVYLVQELFIAGASGLNRVASKNEEDRKKIQVITGLNFDGIEVWLIASLSLMFAVFPLAFSTVLTYLYVPFFLLLFVLIFRGVSIEVIYKLDNEKWVKWMVLLWTVSSILIMFILGIYITNIFLGFPMEYSEITLQYTFTSGFFSIFNTAGITGGLLFVALSLLGGAAYIDLFAGKELGKRALDFVKKFGIIYVVPILTLVVFMGFNNTYASIFTGQLFLANTWLFVFPGLAVVSGLLLIRHGYKQNSKQLFIFSLVTMFFFLATGFLGSFPNIVASRIDVVDSITTLSSVSAKTMNIIFIFICIFFPVIIFYQGWKYKKFMKKVK